MGQETAEGGETPVGAGSLRSAGSGLLTISQTHLTISQYHTTPLTSHILTFYRLLTTNNR